jgi:hypothetical protein
MTAPYVVVLFPNTQDQNLLTMPVDKWQKFQIHFKLAQQASNKTRKMKARPVKTDFPEPTFWATQKIRSGKRWLDTV